MSGVSIRVFTEGDVFEYEHKGYYKISSVTPTYVEIVGVCDFDGYEFKSPKPIRLDKPGPGQWWSGTNKIGKIVSPKDIEDRLNQRLSEIKTEYDNVAANVARLRSIIPTVIFP